MRIKDFSPMEMERMMKSAAAARKMRLGRDEGTAVLDQTAVAISQVALLMRRVREPPVDFDIVPMGHSCTTARFVRHQTGWRGGPEAALPLDWSAATFRVWEHMLSDGFELLLRQRQRANEVHPYNEMFAPDVDVFKHAGRWAALPTQRRRADRLRRVLAAGRAIGLAFYFDGVRSSGCPPLREVVADAVRLAAAQERSFRHIVIVWLERGQKQSPARWTEAGGRVSVLRFAYTSTDFTFGEYLEPEDVVRIAHLLEARFPHVFRSDFEGGGAPP